MQNLRDQLSKAGVITKDQKRQVEQQKRRERKQHKPGQHDDKRREQQQEAHASRLQAQRSADQQRSAEQRAHLIAREKCLQIRHIIEHWQLPLEPSGTQRWYFMTRQNAINCLYVSAPIAAQLGRGGLAIVEHPDAGDAPYVLVEREAVELIHRVDPMYIRFYNAEPSDDDKEM